MAKEKAIIPIPKEFVSDIRQIIDNGRQQALTAASAIPNIMNADLQIKDDKNNSSSSIIKTTDNVPFLQLQSVMKSGASIILN